MKRRLQVLLFFLALICIWQTVSSLVDQPQILPTPAAVLRRLAQLNEENWLLSSIRATLLRMVVGFSISATLGMLLGVFMGLSPLARDSAKSLLQGMQTLPSAAWAPIAILMFGLSDKAIYFVIIMSSVGGVAVAVADGIASVPPVIVRAARTLGTPAWALAHRVILPAALPNIVTGLKLGWTLGWHGAVSAELIRSTIGLGFLLHQGREFNDAPQVVGVMMVTIAVGLLIDKLLFSQIEQHIRQRRGLALAK